MEMPRVRRAPGAEAASAKIEIAKPARPSPFAVAAELEAGAVWPVQIARPLSSGPTWHR